MNIRSNKEQTLGISNFDELNEIVISLPIDKRLYFLFERRDILPSVISSNEQIKLLKNALNSEVQRSYFQINVLNEDPFLNLLSNFSSNIARIKVAGGMNILFWEDFQKLTSKQKEKFLNDKDVLAVLSKQDDREVAALRQKLIPSSDSIVDGQTEIAKKNFITIQTSPIEKNPKLDTLSIVREGERFEKAVAIASGHTQVTNMTSSLYNALDTYINTRWEKAAAGTSIVDTKTRAAFQTDKDKTKTTVPDYFFKKYNHFYSKFFTGYFGTAHSAGVKIQAAAKLQYLLSPSNPKEDIKFTAEELEALLFSDLGKIVNQYKDSLPVEYNNQQQQRLDRLSNSLASYNR